MHQYFYIEMKRQYSQGGLLLIEIYAIHNDKIMVYCWNKQTQTLIGEGAKGGGCTVEVPGVVCFRS